MIIVHKFYLFYSDFHFSWKYDQISYNVIFKDLKFAIEVFYLPLDTSIGNMTNVIKRFKISTNVDIKKWQLL